MLKRFIILIISFFCFSAFAGDDLSGKQIFCSKQWSDGYISAIGVEFTTNDDVIIWHQRNDFELQKRISEYHAYATNIRIHDKLFVANQCTYMIDRTNLNIEYCYADNEGYKSFMGQWCRLEEGNLENIFYERFKHITFEDNLL